MNIESVLKTKKVLPMHSRIAVHIMLVNNRIIEKVAEALKPFDVSIQQFNVLRILRGQKGEPANLSTIQERMINKMSNTTRLVDKLILKGFVDRSICKKNRRKVEIIITEKGISTLTAMDKAVANAERDLVRDMSEKELKQLDVLLNKF
jgi:DNA-binding MarR family transcriptional regulator